MVLTRPHAATRPLSSSPGSGRPKDPWFSIPRSHGVWLSFPLEHEPHQTLSFLAFPKCGERKKKRSLSHWRKEARKTVCSGWKPIEILYGQFVGVEDNEHADAPAATPNRSSSITASVASAMDATRSVSLTVATQTTSTRAWSSSSACHTILSPDPECWHRARGWCAELAACPGHLGGHATAKPNTGGDQLHQLLLGEIAQVGVLPTPSARSGGGYRPCCQRSAVR